MQSLLILVCESVQRKNKGIVSIETYLSAVKLFFNELLRCLELPHETAILPYVLHHTKLYLKS